MMESAKPWEVEPKFKKWIDPATGLTCAIARTSMGALCGYVRVPPGRLRKRLRAYERCHRGYFFGRVWWKCGYNHSSIKGIEVHGGLTFAGSHWLLRMRRGGYWIGFDCAHANDRVPGIPAMNHGHYKDFAYVTAECERLAAQLKARL